MLKLDHPFFAPRWRRLLVLGLCLVWASVEALNGTYLWTGLFVGIAVVAALSWARVDWSKYGNDG